MATQQNESQKDALPHGTEHIALIGLGAIGISFLALHLTYTSAMVTVFDPRPDLREHVAHVLPLYLPETLQVANLEQTGRLTFATSLADAVRHATVVQEQGPENLEFKQRTWADVVRHVSPATHLWSSTSGIPASQQLEALEQSTTAGEGGLSEAQIHSAKDRLLVVHPFNPPHLMPLIELVPSPSTRDSGTAFAQAYFTALPSIHRPITLHKETPGFVANRLAFVLFREACSLVNSGVCSVEDLDEIVRASLGPRWAVAGPFRMYAFGGGAKGMKGFLDNIGDAIHGVWSDADAQPALHMRHDEHGHGHAEGHAHGQTHGHAHGHGNAHAHGEGDAAAVAAAAATLAWKEEGIHHPQHTTTDGHGHGDTHNSHPAAAASTAATLAWKDEIIRQTDDAYGSLGADHIRHRDHGLTAVVRVQEDHAERAPK